MPSLAGRTLLERQGLVKASREAAMAELLEDVLD
jgi:hypothetical protein